VHNPCPQGLVDVLLLDAWLGGWLEAGYIKRRSTAQQNLAAKQQHDLVIQELYWGAYMDVRTPRAPTLRASCVTHEAQNAKSSPQPGGSVLKN